MSESQLQTAVVELARRYGFKAAHFPTAQMARGEFRTAVAADAKGFPDLTLCDGRRLIFVELKADRGRTSPEQNVWLAALRSAGCETHVWTPTHWRAGLVEAVLRGEAQ